MSVRGPGWESDLQIFLCILTLHSPWCMRKNPCASPQQLANAICRLWQSLKFSMRYIYSPHSHAQFPRAHCHSVPNESMTEQGRIYKAKTKQNKQTKQKQQQNKQTKKNNEADGKGFAEISASRQRTASPSCRRPPASVAIICNFLAQTFKPPPKS